MAGAGGCLVGWPARVAAQAVIVIASSMHSRLELTKNETRNKSIIQGDNLNHCAVNATQAARGAAGVAPRGAARGAGLSLVVDVVVQRSRVEANA